MCIEKAAVLLSNMNWTRDDIETRLIRKYFKIKMFQSIDFLSITYNEKYFVENAIHVTVSQTTTYAFFWEFPNIYMSLLGNKKLILKLTIW